MKTLYTFSVEKTKEVDVVKTTVENGVETTTKTKDTQKVPIYFAIKKPSRTEKEEGEMVRGEYKSKYIRRGIISEAVLSKIYSDQKGFLAEAEKQYFDNLAEQFKAKQEEYQLIIATDKTSEKAKALLAELIDIKQKTESFIRGQNVYYEDTAEGMARTKFIEYFFSQLTYFREDENKEWEPFFTGEKFEDKMVHADIREEEGEEYYFLARNKILFILAVILNSDGVVTKERIEELLIEAGFKL